ncbi:hypothetical protein [Taklimakanibacter deserti]|uniref:hypothetical protein n=1 Tax=Taklimakanibacter deserti TaxID=2267839 RepID=UPI000E65429C
MKRLLALWQQAGRYAVALAAIFTGLIFQPPGHALQGSALNWKLLATTVIAFIILFAGKWFAQKSRPVVTVALFLIGIGLVIAYFHWSQLWSCEVGTGRVVIGSVLKPDAAAILAKTPSFSCTDLLLHFASDPRRVYEESAIFLHETLLGTLYFAMIVILSAALLGLTRKP